MNEESEILTSGMLRKEMDQCIEENAESYEFESQEYLISVERANLSVHQESIPIVKKVHVKHSELIQPRERKEVDKIDLISLLEPKKVDKEIRSSDIDSLLEYVAVKRVAIEDSLHARNNTNLSHSENFISRILSVFPLWP